MTSFTRFHDAYGLGIEWDYALGRFRVVDPAQPAWTISKYVLCLYMTVGYLNTHPACACCSSDAPLLRLFVMDNPRAQSGQLAGAVIFLALFSWLAWHVKRRVSSYVQFI